MCTQHQTFNTHIATACSRGHGALGSRHRQVVQTRSLTSGLLRYTLASYAAAYLADRLGRSTGH
eukprot:1872233-Pleurochrysis_carterae.AAC.1